MQKFRNYLNIFDYDIEQTIDTVDLTDSKKYEDPDTKSPELYGSLRRIMQHRIFPNGFQVQKSETFYDKYKNYGLRLTIVNQ